MAIGAPFVRGDSCRYNARRMAPQTLDYAHTQSPPHGMPVSAMVWSGALIGVSIAIAMLPTAGPMWDLVTVLAIAPLPAAVLCAGALAARPHWRLLITLAALILCAQCVIVTAAIAVAAIVYGPTAEGRLALALLLVGSCAVSLSFGIAAAGLATFRRSWYDPPQPAWHRRWLRAAPKLLVIWLLLIWLLSALIP